MSQSARLIASLIFFFVVVALVPVSILSVILMIVILVTFVGGSIQLYRSEHKEAKLLQIFVFVIFCSFWIWLIAREMKQESARYHLLRELTAAQIDVVKVGEREVRDPASFGLITRALQGCVFRNSSHRKEGGPKLDLSIELKDEAPIFLRIRNIDGEAADLEFPSRSGREKSGKIFDAFACPELSTAFQKSGSPLPLKAEDAPRGGK